MDEPAPSAAAQGIIGLSPALAQIHAPDVWASGFRGQGVVVANIDSGVSMNNADLASKWRGGTNSWLDVHNEHSTPVDSAGDGTGHGTATMSVMVGAQTGVAPGAKWIAVKMFSDQGSAQLSDALIGFQWAMDPDGNPATNDAADVVNNSWSQDVVGCEQDDTLHTALQALAAADILPVFAAGNFGPGISTDPIPANYPEAFAVGAVTNLNDIAYFSSRGPTTCRTNELVFPDISAPGMDVAVARPDGSIAYVSGTSFSAPHVAGTLALLLSAFPNLSTEQQRLALLHGVSDLGPAGPDNTYGYGLLNALNAYLWLGGSEPNRLYFPTFLSDGADHQGY
jgi:subtilisin family serine protease